MTRNTPVFVLQWMCPDFNDVILSMANTDDWICFHCAAAVFDWYQWMFKCIENSGLWQNHILQGDMSMCKKYWVFLLTIWIRTMDVDVHRWGVLAFIVEYFCTSQKFHILLYCFPTTYYKIRISYMNWSNIFSLHYKYRMVNRRFNFVVDANTVRLCDCNLHRVNIWIYLIENSYGFTQNIW